MKYKSEAGIAAILFIIIVFVMGICTDYKLMDFYVNDTPYNEYWNPELGRKNETDYSVVFFGKRFYIDINGGIRRLLGQREMNGVVKLDNGQLTMIIENKLDQDILSQEAENIKELYEFCTQESIPFIYILTPDKICPYDPKLPVGEIDHSNDNIDMFVSELNRLSIPYLDIRNEMYVDGIEHYSFFSKTDHHWNAQGGYYAFLKIKEWMDVNKIEYSASASDESNYTLEKYNNKLLGSWGQRTGRMFTGSDDFYVYYPKFETCVVTDEKAGEYRDVLLDESQLDGKGPGFIYDTFYPNTTDVYNEKTDNDTTVFLIGDSFSRECNPFIILSVRNFIFKKAYSSEEITREELIDLHPDALILMHSPMSNLGSEGSFSFFHI